MRNTVSNVAFLVSHPQLNNIPTQIRIFLPLVLTALIQEVSMQEESADRVSYDIGPHTKYVISTSGRPKSLQRYKRLLQEYLQLDVTYLPIHSLDPSSPKIDPEKFVWALRGLPCIGGAISRDIKEAIVPFLDDIDDLAKSINSVNTVVRRGDRLIGYNTDALGFRMAINQGLEKSKRRVRSAVVYGYGGVTNCVVSVLRSMEISVYITGRRLDAAKEKAHQLGVQVWSREQVGKVDLFINAAPVTNQNLMDAVNFLDAIDGCCVAFDHELNGLYLKEYCADKSIYFISGAEMYYPQMTAQWSLFLQDHIPVPEENNTFLKEIFEQIDEQL